MSALQLLFYLDLHAHANKRGCFIFGNALPDDEAQVDAVLFAKLVAVNSPWFDFGGCDFAAKNMYTRLWARGPPRERAHQPRGWYIYAHDTYFPLFRQQQTAADKQSGRRGSAYDG